jgi:hypothetical protein
MNKKWIGAALAILPVAIGSGWVIANSNSKTEETAQANQEIGYICPATGEELPCPKCCPLNGK